VEFVIPLPDEAGSIVGGRTVPVWLFCRMARRVTNPLIGREEEGATILSVDELEKVVPTSPVDEVDNASVPDLLDNKVG
jgi:hypothetical protein